MTSCLAKPIDDYLRGNSGDDVLIGGLGNDTINVSVHYDDGDSNSLGFNDYGLIKDFKLDQHDVIRLHGSADLYELGSIQGSTAIFYKGEGQSAELIGIVQNVTGFDLNSTAFEYAMV